MAQMAHGYEWVGHDRPSRPEDSAEFSVLFSPRQEVGCLELSSSGNWPLFRAGLQAKADSHLQGCVLGHPFISLMLPLLE